jgi:hypothetical protein
MLHHTPPLTVARSKADSSYLALLIMMLVLASWAPYPTLNAELPAYLRLKNIRTFYTQKTSSGCGMLCWMAVHADVEMGNKKVEVVIFIAPI